MKNLDRNKIRMLLQLSRNDIKARYANSIFGILWAFAMPFVTILVFWFVFQLGFKNLPVGDAPYILWFSAAYIPWIFFVDVTTTGCNSLVEYSFLVKKIKFNIEYIPFVKLISALFVHVFFIAFLFLMLLIYSYGFSLYNLQILYYLICTCFLEIGLTWLLSAVNVFFKDLNSIYNIVIQIGFWVSPILWNEDSMANEMVKAILTLNPMHYIVNGYRDSLLFYHGFWENIPETISFWLITLVLFMIGRIVFQKLKPFFADEV